ncbi:BZ3500_MvSof-1268-A1-R1_Chr2-2g04739 [Microbotryum saponariae]|uniref:BZ3500_MvSof-1268-A1-R1_Chr2-2g04739 protein n=1 Tax=Microbotryum saponariae TaxID=289078 RepID=A0A2X0KWA2_9BASI|nr:BZ3500_MvSof-1268-A1-R1_Chr2-2g04739 [Microbotryum saponariae]SDA00044.1 BZ3501_MvSof-1269-A2-R1_Chr2-2g04413 [Microbotryum saponariae]
MPKAYLPDLSTLLKAGAAIGLTIFSGVGALLYLYQNKLIYVASMPAGSRTNVATPDEFGMPDYEQLTLHTPDGVTIRAYLLLRPDAEQEEEAPRPTILFLHANAGNIGHRLPLVKVFYQKLRCNVLALSYRGYGLSEGEADEKGIKIDAQVALDHVLSHPSLEKTPIFLATVAIFLASQNKTRVRGLIVENTFTSLRRLVPSVMRDIQLLGTSTALLAPFLFLLHQIWPSIDLIDTLPVDFPVLFLSGDKDELVPQHHMTQLYVHCSSQNKHWRDFEHGTHSECRRFCRSGAERGGADPCLVAYTDDTCIQPLYFKHIAEFILRTLSTPTSDEEKSESSTVSATVPSAPGSSIDSFELIDREIDAAGGANSVNVFEAAAKDKL